MPSQMNNMLQLSVSEMRCEPKVNDENVFLFPLYIFILEYNVIIAVHSAALTDDFWRLPSSTDNNNRVMLRAQRTADDGTTAYRVDM